MSFTLLYIVPVIPYGYLHAVVLIPRGPITGTSPNVRYGVCNLGRTKDNNSMLDIFFRYTCSVDYWSFGQVAHEIMTGHRPFLPGLPPAAWMKEVQNKKRSVISVIQTWSGDTIHSSSLSKVNHLSRYYAQFG